MAFAGSHDEAFLRILAQRRRRQYRTSGGLVQPLLGPDFRRRRNGYEQSLAEWTLSSHFASLPEAMTVAAILRGDYFGLTSEENRERRRMDITSVRENVEAVAKEWSPQMAARLGRQALDPAP